jgi:hypothetical protein
MIAPAMVEIPKPPDSMSEIMEYHTNFRRFTTAVEFCDYAELLFSDSTDSEN